MNLGERVLFSVSDSKRRRNTQNKDDRAKTSHSRRSLEKITQRTLKQQLPWNIPSELHQENIHSFLHKTKEKTRNKKEPKSDKKSHKARTLKPISRNFRK